MRWQLALGLGHVTHRERRRIGYHRGPHPTGHLEGDARLAQVIRVDADLERDGPAQSRLSEASRIDRDCDFVPLPWLDGDDRPLTRSWRADLKSLRVPGKGTASIRADRSDSELARARVPEAEPMDQPGAFVHLAEVEARFLELDPRSGRTIRGRGRRQRGEDSNRQE